MLEGYCLRNVGGLYLGGRCGIDGSASEVASAALSNELDNPQASGLSKWLDGSIVLENGRTQNVEFECLWDNQE